jgi:hypothetical protein
MKYRFLLVALIFTGLSFTAIGQNNISLLNVFYHRLNFASASSSAESYFLYRQSLNKRFIGNPYLESNWQNGLLISREGKTYEIRGRYRIFDDEVQILQDGKIKALYPHYLQGILLGSSIFISAKWDTPSGIDYSFFELIVDGELRLLKKYKLDVKETKDNFLKIKGSTEEYFYLRDKDDIALPIDLRKAGLMRMMNNHYNEASAYVKKMDKKSEANLIKLFHYYNQL